MYDDSVRVREGGLGMTYAPKLIKRGEGWMLVCPDGHTMQICNANQMITTDQALIVVRKVE